MATITSSGSSRRGVALLLLLSVFLLACRAPVAAGANNEIPEDGTSPKFPGCDNPFENVSVQARRSIDGLAIQFDTEPTDRGSFHLRMRIGEGDVLGERRRDGRPDRDHGEVRRDAAGHGVRDPEAAGRGARPQDRLRRIDQGNQTYSSIPPPRAPHIDFFNLARDQLN